MSGHGTKRDDQAVELVERLPTVDEYVELLRRVGWTSPPVEDCQRALGGSLTAICAVDERKAVVGMGRLVGDGRMYCFAVAYEVVSTTLVTTQRCLPILRSRTNPSFS